MNKEIENLKMTVFGATGKTGRELLKFFSGAKLPVQAVTRDLSKIQQLPFVDWVKGDLADKQNLAGLLKGTKGIYLATAYSPQMDELQRNAFEAAKDADVGHIVKLSSMSAANPAHELSRKHAQAENTLKGSGVDWTILQPCGFLQNWLGDFSETIKKERKIYQITGERKLLFIDAKDIAEVAFKVLTESGKHKNKTYVLTGDEGLSYYEVADKISAVLGEKVTFVNETPEEARIRMEKKGTPAWLINFFLTMGQSTEARQPDVSPSVHEILGKPARTVESFVREHLEWFK